MTRNRLMTIVLALALIGMGVTFLGAASRTGSAGSPTVVEQKSNGLVVFGTVETEQGSMPLFPETFPLPCKITKVLVKEGETVKKDQVLLEADPEEADLAIEAAKLKQQQAQDGVEAAQAKVHQAEQMLEANDVAIAYQEKTLESKGKDLDAAKKKLEGAEQKERALQDPNRPPRQPSTDLQAAQDTWLAASTLWAAEKTKLDGMKKIRPVSKREEAEAGLKEAKHTLELAAVGVKKAERDRRILTLKAPADGKILGRYVEVGQTFGPQTRQPAFLFNFQGPLQVHVEVDQEWAGRVQVEMNAVVEENFKSGDSWPAKVTKVGDAFIQKRTSSAMPDPFQSNEPRILPCTITIDKARDVSKLRIGEQVKVRIGNE